MWDKWVEIDLPFLYVFTLTKQQLSCLVSGNLYTLSSSSVCSSITPAAERSFDISIWRGKKKPKPNLGGKKLREWLFWINFVYFFCVVFFLRSKSPYSASSYSGSSYTCSKSRSGSSHSCSYSQSCSHSDSRSYSRSLPYPRRGKGKSHNYRSRSRSHGYHCSRSRSPPYRRYHSRSRSPVFRGQSPTKRPIPQGERRREYFNRYREVPPSDLKVHPKVTKDHPETRPAKEEKAKKDHPKETKFEKPSN